MQYFPRNDLRCPVCLAEWNSNAGLAAGIKGCPRCKTALEPLRIAEDGFIKLNWQDLRVLAIYAHRWSAIFDTQKKGNRDAITALKHIIDKVQRFRPQTGAALVPDQVMIEVKIDERPRKPLMPGNGPLTLVPGPDGKIVSPFFRVFGPIGGDEGEADPA